jgi:translation initiation factor IF-2
MEQTPISFPPVVTVLGHVDHGKTSLLDAIRETSIAAREHGGITQKIGTSSVVIDHEGKKARITFIDTPGHAAFAKMRGRGANAADIGLLIVASNDGVMPQTKESIALLQAAKIPFIVVLTKADLPTKNIDHVKQQLATEGVLLEGLGGDIPVIEVSAQTRMHIKELLDLILLVWEFADKSALSESAPLKAVVIESKRDPKSGSKATVIVKNGHMQPREDVFVDDLQFRIRSVTDEQGKPVEKATVGDGVEIQGMNDVLEVGSVILDKKGLAAIQAAQKPLQKAMVYQTLEKETTISIILTADTKGSLEAIMGALPKGIKIISSKTGEVSEADVLMAKSTGSIVISFSVKLRPEIMKLATTEKVLVRNYTIIYEMLDELTDALEGKVLAQTEEIYGVSRVLAKFPFEKTFAYGIAVLEGRVAARDKIRIMRGEEPVGEASIQSLRVGKDQTNKVEEKREAGVVISGTLDIEVGDVILSHS